MQDYNILLMLENKYSKRDYKCAICHRKPQNECGGWKGWICNNCFETRKEDIKEHYAKLEKRRKYEIEPYTFKSIEELMQEKFVFFGSKLYNIAVIRNWSYHMLSVRLSYFNKAKLKEEYINANN